MRVHSLAEIDRDEFWKFLEEAVAAFGKQTARRQQNPEDLMPWKVLGRKWHLARKGFPPGKKVEWPLGVLERLLGLLEKTAPDGDFDWHQQQVVHLRLSGSAEPWASVFTKRKAVEKWDWLRAESRESRQLWQPRGACPTFSTRS